LYLPKLRLVSHAHRPRSQISDSAGQCMNGLCSYPISRKKWMRSVPANSAAAIECTGASPQRYHISYTFGSYFGAARGEKGRLYLVVKATKSIKVLKERRVGLTAPKVHIGNLKIAPNYYFLELSPGQHCQLTLILVSLKRTYSGRDCSRYLRYRKGSSSRCSVRRIRGARP